MLLSFFALDGTWIEVLRLSSNSYKVYENGFVAKTVNAGDLLAYLLVHQHELENNLGPDYERLKNQLKDMSSDQ